MQDVVVELCQSVIPPYRRNVSPYIRDPGREELRLWSAHLRAGREKACYLALDRHRPLKKKDALRYLLGGSR